MQNNKEKTQWFITKLVNNFSISTEVLDELTRRGFEFVEGEIEEGSVYYRFEKEELVRDKAGVERNCIYSLTVGYDILPVSYTHLTLPTMAVV